MCGKEFGKYFGASYGLVYDIVFGKAIGVFLLLFMILGYIFGNIGKGFSKDNKTTTIMMVCAGSVIFDIMFLAFSKIIYNYNIDFLYSIFTIIKSAIYNIIIAFILFKPLLFLAEIINKSKNNYYLL